jgi:hypothetical protein
LFGAVETSDTFFVFTALIEAFSLDTDGPCRTLCESALFHAILTIADESCRALGVNCADRITCTILTDGSSDTPHQGTSVSALGVQTEPARKAISVRNAFRD